MLMDERFRLGLTVFELGRRPFHPAYSRLAGSVHQMSDT